MASEQGLIATDSVSIGVNRSICARIGRGFSLLELILTLAVAVAIAAITLPNIFDMLAYRQLIRSGEGLRIAMVQARLEAMRSGRTQMMRFQTAGPQFTVEPYITAEDITEAADMTGRGTGVMTGANVPISSAMAPPASNSGQAVDSQGFMTARMDNEMLVGNAVFGAVQVQATARSATLQQQAATLNSGSAGGLNGGDGQWSQPIVFYPDGTTSNAVVAITMEGVGQVFVKIRGLTGSTDLSGLQAL